MAILTVLMVPNSVKVVPCVAHLLGAIYLQGTAAKITVPDNGPYQVKIASAFRHMISHGIHGDCDNNAEAGQIYGKRGGVMDCLLFALEKKK